MGKAIPFKPQDAYPLTTAWSPILGFNADREYLGFQNLGAVNVRVRFTRAGGGDAGEYEYLLLLPTDFIGYDVKVPDNEIWARSETGTSKLVVTEA